MTTDIDQHQHNKVFNYASNGEGKLMLVEPKGLLVWQEKCDEIFKIAMVDYVESLDVKR